MSWVETGGPSVGLPKKRGFGTRMIERGLAQDLGGHVMLDFAETGIICTIDAPLELVTTRVQLQ
jgi:two-component sensor histidine kinase